MIKLKKDLTTAAIAIVLFTLVLGIGYPLAITGIARVAFGDQAGGSQIRRDGRVVGSRLIGAPRLIARRPDPAYFRPRSPPTSRSRVRTTPA